jgi:hypothetical protein
MKKPLYLQIKEKFQLGPASHMTHISNLQEIVKNDLLSHNQMLNQNYFDLSDASVQLGREQKLIPHTQLNLHDFVPIYFGWKTPMVMQQQDKNEDIIFLRFSLDILETQGTYFTDGNARSNKTQFFSFTELDSLSVLNPKAINDVKWVGDNEKKRQKQAEILVPNRVLFSQVFDIICYSDAAKNRILDILRKSGITKQVWVNDGWYYKP